MCVFIHRYDRIFGYINALPEWSQFKALLFHAPQYVYSALRVAVAWLYSTDTPTNLFPSIHVYNSLGIHFAVMHSSYFKDKKHVQHASLVLCVLIILSTMFIKQHSVFDVSTAFMLAFVMYNVVYIKNWMHLPQKSGSFQDTANSKVRV